MGRRKRQIHNFLFIGAAADNKNSLVVEAASTNK